MKGDMSGAAAVLGVLKVLPRLKPAVEVHGVVAATDNMPSGSATPNRVISSARACESATA